MGRLWAQEEPCHMLLDSQRQPGSSKQSEEGEKQKLERACASLSSETSMAGDPGAKDPERPAQECFMGTIRAWSQDTDLEGEGVGGIMARAPR